SAEDEIHEYDLSVAWDISSAVWQQLFSVASEETAPQGLFFKPDGSKVYIIGQQNTEINEYDLSVAWDISSAVWQQLFSVSTEEVAPSGLFFKPDGLKMYIIGSAEDEINEYDLSVAWDISSAVWQQLFSVTSKETFPNGLFFKPDGSKVYSIGQQNAEIHEYDLSVAWDISSAVWQQLFSVASEETAPQGLFFKPDGNKLYIIGTQADEINEYNLFI
ncbi:unnamed protein product, partial [marine sediment metagenome]